MPFLPPNQQRQSTETKLKRLKIKTKKTENNEQGNENNFTAEMLQL